MVDGSGEFSIDGPWTPEEELRLEYADSRARILTDQSTSWEQKLRRLSELHMRPHRRLDALAAMSEGEESA